jgi:hypothetical protein
VRVSGGARRSRQQVDQHPSKGCMLSVRIRGSLRRFGPIGRGVRLRPCKGVGSNPIGGTSVLRWEHVHDLQHVQARGPVGHRLRGALNPDSRIMKPPLGENLGGFFHGASQSRRAYRS